jgi:predicted ester cyclase
MIAKFTHILFAAASLGLSACAGSDDVIELDGAVPTGETEQVSVIEQRIAATNRQNWSLWESLHTANVIRTAPELAEPLRGPSALRAAIEVLSTAFPDYHLELEQAFGQDEWLAVRLHTTGTMTGPLLLSEGVEVPATGRSIEQDWTALVRFEGNRIAEFHEFYDQLLLMQQLGLAE